jgi:predicted dehydrogenase
VSEITGLRRGSDRAEALAVPDHYYGTAARSDVFSVFQHQSVGPRHFIDAITEDFPAGPSFHDGHEVQRIVEAAVDSHRTGAAQTL